MILLGVALLVVFGVAAALPSTRALTSRIASLEKYSQAEELTFREKRWGSFLEIARANPLLGTGEASLDGPEEERYRKGENPP